MHALLSVPAIRSIFLAQFISVTGDRMFAIALAWWVVSKEDLPNRELTLGLLLATSTLPIALCGPLFGPLVDGFNKRSCMVVADAGRLLLMIGLGFLIHRDFLTLPLLIALCIPLFALEPLFDSAVSASLSSVCKSPLMLAQSVALESAIPNAAAVLGALFGSLALAAWSVEGVIWFNAGTFLVSLLFVSMLPALKASTADADVRGNGDRYSFLNDFPIATRLLILFGIGNFFVAPLFLYLPLLARDVLHGDGSQLGLLELAFAVGNLTLYGYFVIRPKRFFRTRWLRFFPIASSAGFLWVLGDTKSLWTMLAALGMWGASCAFVTYLAVSSFQRTIPDAYKGRFFAILTSLCTLGMPISFVCFGFLSSRFALKEIIFANAACALLVSLAFLTVPDEEARDRC
jgi:predicted MFS family arabinose efflux permease